MAHIFMNFSCASLLWCVIAYISGGACNAGLLGSRDRPLEPNEILLSNTLESIAEFPDGSNVIARQSLRMRLIPSELDEKKGCIWIIRIEKLKIELVEEKKEFSFDLQHWEKRENRHRPTILDLLQTDKIKMHLKPDLSCTLSGYPQTPMLPAADVPKEIMPDLQFVVSEPYLRLIAMQAFPTLQGEMKKGSGWKVKTHTPGYLRFLGKYEFITQYVVEDVNGKIARIGISQTATTLPGKKTVSDLPTWISGEIKVNKSTGYAVVDLSTRRLNRMSVESTIIGDLVIEVAEAKSQVNLRCKLLVEVQTSK